MAITAAAFITAGCSKTRAEVKPDAIVDFPVDPASPTGSSIGTVSITEAGGGEARVTIKLDKSALTPFTPPFDAMLRHPEPLAYLNPVNPETGISETSPVMAANKNLTVSYDLLLYTKDLELVVSDANKKIITITQLR